MSELKTNALFCDDNPDCLALLQAAEYWKNHPGSYPVFPEGSKIRFDLEHWILRVAYESAGIEIDLQDIRKNWDSMKNNL